GGCDPIERADRHAVLLSRLHPRHIFHAHGSAIRGFANNNVAELFRRSQAPLRQQCVGELLVLLGWLATYLASWIYFVLGLDGVRNIRDSNAQFRQLIGLYPEPHGILASSEALRPADSIGAADGSVEAEVAMDRENSDAA